MVGNVPLGSDHPIRIQTMTTSDTKDVAKTVEEVHPIRNSHCFSVLSLRSLNVGDELPSLFQMISILGIFN